MNLSNQQHRSGGKLRHLNISVLSHFEDLRTSRFAAPNIVESGSEKPCTRFGLAKNTLSYPNLLLSLTWLFPLFHRDSQQPSKMDPDEIDDPDLRAAIRASLRDVNDDGAGPSSAQGPSKDVVDLTFDSDNESDIEEVFPKSNAVIGADTDDEADDADEDTNDSDDDEEIRRAIAMSLQDQHRAAASPKEESPVEAVPSQLSAPLPTHQSPPLGLLGLNRKQMEEERLARLAKRKADSSASPSAPSPAKKIARIEDGRFVSDSASEKKDTNTPPSISLPSSSKPTPHGVQWPLGVVKKTYLKRSPDDNDITLEQVLQKDDLQLAVMSSYLWDMDWLFTKCDTKRTRFIMIMSAKEQALVRFEDSIL